MAGLYWVAMLYYALIALYVLICLLLLIVVLLQQGKGGDIAAAFGGASSQTAFGARAGATVLTRATTILGTLFMLAALALAIVNKTGSGGSVMSGVAAPKPAATQPAAPALPGGAPAGSTAQPTPPLPTPAANPSAIPADAPKPANTRPADAGKTPTEPPAGRRGGGRS